MACEDARNTGSPRKKRPPQRQTLQSPRNSQTRCLRKSPCQTRHTCPWRYVAWRFVATLAGLAHVDGLAPAATTPTRKRSSNGASAMTSDARKSCPALAPVARLPEASSPARSPNLYAAGIRLKNAAASPVAICLPISAAGIGNRKAIIAIATKSFLISARMRAPTCKGATRSAASARRMGSSRATIPARATDPTPSK